MDGELGFRGSKGSENISSEEHEKKTILLEIEETMWDVNNNNDFSTLSVQSSFSSFDSLLRYFVILSSLLSFFHKSSHHPQKKRFLHLFLLLRLIGEKIGWNKERKEGRNISLELSFLWGLFDAQFCYFISSVMILLHFTFFYQLSTRNSLFRFSFSLVVVSCFQQFLSLSLPTSSFCDQNFYLTRSSSKWPLFLRVVWSSSSIHGAMVSHGLTTQ